jgi:hypothetical protein
MDEMPMYFDSPTNRTFDQTGAETIKIKTSNSEKLRFTLILCAYNDGSKCLPAIIFKGLKKVPKCKFPKGIVIMVSESGSINTEILNEWRDKVYGQRPYNLFLNIHSKRKNGPKYRSLLTFDSATPHRNSEFKNVMAKNYDTKVEIIPAGMTPLIQPADVSWNKSVKTSVKNQWREWIRGKTPGTPENYTKSGYLKRPSYDTVALWCLNAWNELSKAQIIDSFWQCGLGAKRDDTLLNSKLLDIISKGKIPVQESDEEKTGISDDEEVEELTESIDFSDDEEIEESIDF